MFNIHIRSNIIITQLETTFPIMIIYNGRINLIQIKAEKEKYYINSQI